MNIKHQFVLNGAYITEEESQICFENRAFLYGDSIFETIRVNNRNILFFEEHLARLVSGMHLLKYHIPEKFTTFKHQLKDEIIGLLNRNKNFKSSRIRISVFRKSGGLYTPQTNKTDYIISSSDLETEKFRLNQHGLNLTIFKDIKKPINRFSPFKTANSLIYILAGIYKTENSFDECLILNERNQIIEAVSSNLFLVRNKTLITPPVSGGCINGIMRNNVITYAELYDIPCIERSVSESDLLSAEEIFLTNSINGIQWAVAYKNKRYFKRISDFLLRQINDVTV